MQRNEKESFEAYKARRAESNAAVRSLNAESKGGTKTARENRRASISAGRSRGIGITRAASTSRSAGAARRVGPGTNGAATNRQKARQAVCKDSQPKSSVIGCTRWQDADSIADVAARSEAILLPKSLVVIQ